MNPNKLKFGQTPKAKMKMDMTKWMHQIIAIVFNLLNFVNEYFIKMLII